MRRRILTTLVLLPVTALAHAATSAGPQPSSSSASVSAALKTPAATATSAVNANHALVREYVQTQMNGDLLGTALHQAGTLEYAFYGSLPTSATAPSITRAVEVSLSSDELAAQPAVTSIVIRATVDQYGYPRNLSIAKSAGALMDRKALAAVSQYLFKPAMLNNKPVDAPITISIKIAKP